MKRKNLVIIVGLILTAGILFYLYQAGLVSKILKSGTSEPVKTAAISEHQGHAGGAIQSQAAAPVEAQGQEEEEEVPTVEIPLEQQQMIGVKTWEVALKPLQKIIRTVGRIEYDERKLATVNTKIEGWIEKLYVDYTGKYVRKGEPLAEIYSPELFATQQEFISLLKWGARSETGDQKSETGKMLSRDTEAIVEAARERLRFWDITDKQIKKIEKTGKPVRTMTIYSPASGYVVQKMAIQGMRVMPGEKLFDVADLSSVWIISDIYEYELPLVKAGQTAVIGLSYFPGREFSALIDYVYPTLAGETRTAKVRFTIPNPGGQMKPQMFTNVEIKINLGKRLAVPEDAVIDTGIRQIVYVDKGDGYFEPREVTIGLKAEGMVEVIKGLKAKEKVAVAANFLIDSEAQLKGVTPVGDHKH
ncbi:MAG: efflux RND transporter periplasmic adaptor subunit [Syntrophales bacterium]|nr:efflux RND transporter periplasmic adaptor subunit [Syntrophales bacterium]